MPEIFGTRFATQKIFGFSGFFSCNGRFTLYNQRREEKRKEKREKEKIMIEELTDIELAQLIRFYCELYTQETDPRKKKLWQKSICIYCDEAKNLWFGA